MANFGKGEVGESEFEKTNPIPPCGEIRFEANIAERKRRYGEF